MMPKLPTGSGKYIGLDQLRAIMAHEVAHADLGHVAKAQAVAAGASSILWERRGFKWNAAWRLPNLALPQLRVRAAVRARGSSGLLSSSPRWSAQCGPR